MENDVICAINKWFARELSMHFSLHQLQKMKNLPKRIDAGNIPTNNKMVNLIPLCYLLVYLLRLCLQDKMNNSFNSRG